ncbi:MAG: HNH endonuclease [Ignavibacteria bacterium GWF2_33_9]|nr:MAG: HNH endonuclease [Ignavibacteria bacterium GWF2_33_9]
MKIELKEITVRELANGYKDNAEEGVIGYGGKLDIRPPYQREFIYKDKQRDAVITTIRKNFPLNVMYWAVREDGNYEIIDGQQRTISVCQYLIGDFSYYNLYFHNLQDDEQEQILNYKLMIYLCSGTDSERLEWFRTINIAGEKLTDQELRNAVYSGSWVTDAKRYFSKNGCAAYSIGHNYLTGSPIRQEYLETAIDWITDGKIEVYMSKHQHDPNATALWMYFQSVITWVQATFPVYRKEMKGIDWGRLYNKYKDKIYDTKQLESEILKLIDDDDVQSIKGIYLYILTGEEKHLNLRQFDEKTKRKVYEQQEGICTQCKKHFEITEMEADHILPWHRGGKTIIENCQMLCKLDNRTKSGK